VFVVAFDVAEFGFEFVVARKLLAAGHWLLLLDD